MKRPLSLIVLAGSLAGAALLTGCGDDDTTAAAATTAAASKTAVATTAAANKTTAAATTAAAGGTAIVLENPTVLPDGLKYVDEVVGSGASPTMSQTVTVNYTGKLAVNGKVFDSTAGKQPISFPMNRVIKGFAEGLSTMKVGGKRTVFIPAALGYGAAGHPPAIPGNSDLVFEIELIAIK